MNTVFMQFEYYLINFYYHTIFITIPTITIILSCILYILLNPALKDYKNPSFTFVVSIWLISIFVIIINSRMCRL